MKYLKNAFELYLNSSIHVSLAVVSFCLISYLHYNVTIAWDLIFFIFFASVSGYNFVKYAGIAKLYHLRLARNLRLIQIFSLLCFTGLVFFSFKLKFVSLLIVGIMGMVTFFYAFPVLSKRRNLRSLPGIKIFIIAFVWAGTTVALPLSSLPNIEFHSQFIEFTQRLLFVIVLILPFEIRDLHYDDQKLGTIPQIIGVQKTKFLGIILLCIIAVIELFQIKIIGKNILPLFASLMLTGIFLWKSKINQKEFFSSFWVESIPIVYFVLELVSRDYFLKFFD